MRSRFSWTPSMSRTACGNSASSSWLGRPRAARTSVGSSSRSSAANRMSSASLRALVRALIAPLRSVGEVPSSGAAEVLAGAGVDLDLLAGGDEQRHLDLRAGLHGGGLVAAGGAVALQAGLGLGDLQHDGGGKLDVQRRVVVEGDRGVLLGKQVVGRVADDGVGDVGLVVGLGVHEDEVVALAVEVLHLPLVDAGHLDLGAGVEGLVDRLAGQDVLQLGSDERAALAGLDVLELQDGPQL